MNKEPQNDDEIVWDIEDIKQAYIDNAKEYDKIMKKEDTKNDE